MKKYKFESWNVAYRRYEMEIERNKNVFHVIPNPLLYWAADPFVIKKDEKYIVFAELYNRITYKGRIGYCIISDDFRKVSRWKTAIKADVHLSFPYILKENGELYIMPESCKAGDLRLYKCIKFPSKWVLSEKLLEQVMMADTIFVDRDTMISYDNISRPRKLLVYRKRAEQWYLTDSVDDPDIMLRPAGKVFRINGIDYIPLQKSSEKMYGREVRIYKLPDGLKFSKLSDHEYSLYPGNTTFSNLSDKAVGIHTFNFDEVCEVVDVKYYTSNIFSLLGYAICRIKEKVGIEKR